MNLADLEILEAIREILAAVSGLRTVRLVRTEEPVEMPLSRLPAAVLEPSGTESLTWPEAPVRDTCLRGARLPGRGLPQRHGRQPAARRPRSRRTAVRA